MKESTGIVGYFDFITGCTTLGASAGWLARDRKTIMNNRVIGLGLSLYSLAPLFLNDATIPRVVVSALWIIDDETTWIPFVPPFSTWPWWFFTREPLPVIIAACTGWEKGRWDPGGESRTWERESIGPSWIGPFFKNIFHLQMKRSTFLEERGNCLAGDNESFGVRVEGTFLRNELRKLKASSSAECIIFVISRGESVNLIEGY